MNKKTIICCLALTIMTTNSPCLLHNGSKSATAPQSKNVCPLKMRPEAGENLELVYMALTLCFVPITIIYHIQNNKSPDWLTSLINYSAKHDLTKVFKKLYPLHCKLSREALPFFADEQKSALYYTIENRNKELFTMIIKSWDRHIGRCEGFPDALKVDDEGNNFFHWLARISQQNKKLDHMINFAINKLYIDQDNILRTGINTRNLKNQLPVNLASPTTSHLFTHSYFEPKETIEEPIEEPKLPLPSDEHFKEILDKIGTLSFNDFVILTKWYAPYFYKKNEKQQTLGELAFKTERFNLCELLCDKGYEFALTPDEKREKKEAFIKLFQQRFKTNMRSVIKLCATNKNLLAQKTHEKIKKAYFCDMTFTFKNE